MAKLTEEQQKVWEKLKYEPVSVPAFTFESDGDTGFTSAGGQLRLIAGGVECLRITRDADIEKITKNK